MINKIDVLALEKKNILDSPHQHAGRCYQPYRVALEYRARILHH